MSDATATSRAVPEQTFDLSRIVGTPGMAAGQRVGEVDDFVIVDKDRFAEVTHLVIRQPFGRPSLVVPWERVVSFGRDRVVLELDEQDATAGALPSGAVLLKDYILDKKVIDGKGRELEVVYDLGMALRGGRLLVIDVDLSKRALLRRIHLSWLAWLITPAGKSLVNRVPWIYIEPLPEEMSSFRGEVRLKVLKEQLAELPPVDLADILEELGDEERMAVFSHLETEHASDTLEALDPAVQRDLIESLDKERAAVLIDEMTPAQAADVLAALPRWEVGVILNLLANDPEKSAKIKSILANQEERVLDFSSSAFLQFPPETSVAQVRTEFRTAALRKMDITYIYVIDSGDQVVGVVDLKTLLLAEEQRMLRDIMTTSVVSLPPESTLRDASEFFGRYLFRVLPVIDEHGRMLGILPYRDVVALRHRFVK